MLFECIRKAHRNVFFVVVIYSKKSAKMEKEFFLWFNGKKYVLTVEDAPDGRKWERSQRLLDFDKNKMYT